jgi:PAS domain S-box-containing protein
VINKTSKEAYGVDVPPYFEIYSRVALTGKPEVFETYFAPLDKYFSISVYCPYKGSFATIFENITERKKAENENERIQKLLEDSQRIGKIGGWEVNLDTMELKWTREMYHIHEVDLTFKPTVDQRVNFYTPESLPILDQAFQNAMEQGGSYEVDSEIITAKGNRRSVKSIGEVDIKNRRVFGLFQDITERKQAEKALKESEHRFRNNMEHVKLISVMLDTNGNITFANNYFLQLTGWQREEIIGQNWFEIFIPSELKLSQILYPENSNSIVPTNNENEILTRTGERRLIEWSNTILHDSFGNNSGIAGIGVDITDRKLAEAELKIKNEQLIELNATKDKFFSIIAHDLKTPFSGILGFSEILKDEARNLDIDSIEDYADILHSTAKQTFKLLENLLDWARIQQGGFHFEPKTISYNYLLKTEIEGLKYNADRKNITLENGTVQEITFTADEKMLSTVLRNLISNAIKFTPKGGKINIEARSKVDHVEVSISDTGVGMEKETLQKLFKIETSFTSRGTENEKGTGLGLLLCKEFVEKHGGTIWVDSEKGKGSTFSFSIPLTTKIQ